MLAPFPVLAIEVERENQLPGAGLSVFTQAKKIDSEFVIASLKLPYLSNKKLNSKHNLVLKKTNNIF